jgi:hypothetical protein
MILLSPDAVIDIERLRTFLDRDTPDAARGDGFRKSSTHSTAQRLI